MFHTDVLRSSSSSSAVHDRLETIEETLQLLLEEKHGLHQRQPFVSPSQLPDHAKHAIHVHLDSSPHRSDGTDAPNGREEMHAPVSFEDTVDGMVAITFSDETESGFFGTTISSSLPH